MPEDSSKPKNIFEAASGIEKARARKAALPKKEIPQKEARTPAALSEERTKLKGVMSDTLLKAKKLHEEIASQVDSLFSKNRVAPSDYRRYLSRPKNFSQKEWEYLQEQRKKNETLLTELAKKIGAKRPASAEPKKEEEKPLPPSEEKAPEEKPKEIKQEEKPKPKKPKIITRRQWIGM